MTTSFEDTQIGYGSGNLPISDNGATYDWPAGAGGGSANGSSSGAATSGGGGGGVSFPTGATTPISPVVPVPSFSYAVEPLKIVRFTDYSLNGPFRYLWTFGDGSTSNQQNPIHAYSSEGTYLVTLSVQNSVGIRSTSHSITVTDISKITTISALVGGFTAYCRFTGNFTPSSYLWDFGDGETAAGAAPNHTYAANGNYTVTLYADGVAGSANITVDTEILLTWQDNSTTETGFRIYHSLNNNDWTLIKTVGAGVTSYGVTLAVDGVDSSVRNYFKVVAYNGGGESAATNVVSVQCGGA